MMKNNRKINNQSSTQNPTQKFYLAAKQERENKLLKDT